jgi:Family of unknown function (DUF6174)
MRKIIIYSFVYAHKCVRNSMLIALPVIMVACGGGKKENSAEQPEKQKVEARETLSKKKAAWEAFKKSISSNYQMEYIHGGFLPNSGVHYFTEVTNGVVSFSNESGASSSNVGKVDTDSSVTMDGLFQEAEIRSKEANCNIKVRYFDQKISGKELPAIQVLLVSCGSEGYSKEVLKFYVGHPINTQTGMAK